MAATVPTTATRAVLDNLAAVLRAEADAAHAQYPQYRGHWDGWRVAEITERVRTKSGVAFEPGDLVLVAPATRLERVPPRRGAVPYEAWEQRTFATAYSRRNGCDTGVPAGMVREVTVVEVMP